jgi:uncharacterized pyridoxamine 5'-phosphate oxidase family protein
VHTRLKSKFDGVSAVHTHDFEEIRSDFLERVNRMIWCGVATVDLQGRPRSRMLHPYWEERTGWITTDPRSLKAKHIERNPYVSLAYIGDTAKPVYVDAFAEWATDRETKLHVWNLFLQAEPPLGFDPASVYGSVDEPKPDGPLFGVLKLTPYRITLYQWPTPPAIWTPSAESPPTA